jgi:CcmD family protein
MKVRTLVLAVLLFAGPAYAQQQPARPATPDGFVPVDTPINAQDTIPAPRLVGIAYGFIWVVLFGYVWSVRTRLASVERELQTVSKRVGSGGR